MDFSNDFDIKAKRGRFSTEIEKILRYFEEQKYNYPTFIFIDPFGFKDIAFSHIERLMSLEKVEILINFDINGLIRNFHTNDDITQQHIIRFFGDKDVLSFFGDDGVDESSLRDYFHSRLKTISQYVRYFILKNKFDVSEFYLYFLSNHWLGHCKMKESMWRVDDSGSFTFSDKMDTNQIIMISEEYVILELSKILIDKYKNGGFIDCDLIDKYIVDKTPYISKHKNLVLNHLESEEIIEVGLENSRTGKKRRKGTFPPGTIVRFLIND